MAPFAVAADVAATAKPTIPYAIMVEPYKQAVSRRGPPVEGVLVSAAYHYGEKKEEEGEARGVVVVYFFCQLHTPLFSFPTGDHEALDSGETTACSPACDPFR